MSLQAARPSRPRIILIGVAAITLVLLTIVGLKLARGNQTLGEVKLHPYRAADFSLDLLNGGRFSLGDQRGKVVVLNFWASWCVPCQDEAPLLESAWQRYRGEDVVFIGVDIKDTPDDARSFLRRYVSSYPNGFDAQKRIYIEYGVYGLPETFVVDPDGQIVHHVIGPVTQPQLTGWLDSLVALGPAAAR